MNNIRKEDRRILRTRKALNQAMAELVKEKGYESVTVEDITTRANLGRTTFYLHYKDKEDLLLENLESQLSKLVSDITQHPLIFWLRENENSLINTIFKSVKENSDIFTIVAQEQSNRVYDHFRNIIRRIAQQMIDENPWAQRKVQKLNIPIDFVIEYFSGAIWASIVWWARNGFYETSEEMSKSFRTLFFPGLLKLLNVKRFADLVEIVAN